VKSVAAEDLYGFVHPRNQAFSLPVDLGDGALDGIFPRELSWCSESCPPEPESRGHGRFDVSRGAVDHRFHRKKSEWPSPPPGFSFIKAEVADLVFQTLLRSLVYFEEVISTCFDPPTQEAPSVNRPAFRILNATMWPRPIFVV